jgi:hypothetical protein
VEITIATGSIGPTTVLDLGKAHQIHVVVNNCQEEYQLTMLETLGIIVDKTLSILIDPSATNIFIFGVALKRIKVKAVELDEFIFVEMASGAKKRLEERLRVVSLTWESLSPGPTCTSWS